MGWILPDIIRRDRMVQAYRFDEWLWFCCDHQLHLVYGPMRDAMALLLGDFLSLPDEC